MLLVIAIVPGLLFLISLATTGHWRLSVSRSVAVVLMSLAAALLGAMLGNKFWVEADRSGDASALTAGVLFGLFVAGPCTGLLVYWASVGFSVAYRKVGPKQ
jgi:hypothetical protein